MTRIDDEELRARLTPEQYAITREAATERAFTGEHVDNHDDGRFHCIVCAAELFDSDDKFDSGTGWPSFSRGVDDAPIGTTIDSSHGMIRTEVTCASCQSHLGHVFPDGPGPTGLRYCINSGALDFAARDDDAGAEDGGA